MVRQLRIAPPYSLVLVCDPTSKDVPRDFPPAPSPRLIATESCIGVGCLSFVDGETDIKLGSLTEVDPGSPPAFQKMLKTPSRRVAIETVERVILEMPVSGLNTMVRVWTNHPSEPDEVIVGIE